MNVEEDLTPEQLEGLTVHYVSTFDEVLAIALPPAAKGKEGPARGSRRGAEHGVGLGARSN